MHQTDNATSSSTMPAFEPIGPNPNGFFQPENAELGVAATIIDHSYLNALMLEVCNVITGAGFALVKGTNNQLFTAINSLINAALNGHSEKVVKNITQNSHGFVKGELLYFNGTNWLPAKALSLSTSWTVGIVSNVQSTNIFELLMLGYIEGLSGLIPGLTHYLSVTTAGAMQSTAPIATGQVKKAVLIADSSSSGYFYNYLPTIIGADSGGGGGGGDMFAANNLSELTDKAAARSNLVLGSASQKNTTDFIASSEYSKFLQSSDIAGLMVKAANLADVTNTTVARTNLGLGTAAQANSTDFIAASHYSDFAQQSNLDAANANITTNTNNIATNTTNIATNTSSINSINTALSNKQPLDSTLTNFSQLAITTDSLPYGNGSDTFATTPLTTFGRSLIDDASSSVARTTLGLGSLAVLNTFGAQNIVGGRLTPTSGVPVVTNATAITTIYYTAFRGNVIGLYNGTSWDLLTFTELTITLPNTQDTIYDVFLYNNGGVLGYELIGWTDYLTRSTAIVLQDGVYVKSGALTRRWVGSVKMMQSTAGQTESSTTFRLIYNYYNQTKQLITVAPLDNTWTYNAYNTWRVANNNQGNLIGVLNTAPNEGGNIWLNYQILAKSSGTSVTVAIGIGVDGNSPPSQAVRGFGPVLNSTAAVANAFYNSGVTAGYHYYQPWESIWGATDTVTFTRASTVDCGHFLGWSMG